MLSQLAYYSRIYGPQVGVESHSQGAKYKKCMRAGAVALQLRRVNTSAASGLQWSQEIHTAIQVC